MAKQVDLSLSEKVKLVPELELPGVTQESVAKKYGVSCFYIAGVTHAYLKRMILFEIARAEAIVAEKKARRQ